MWSNGHTSNGHRYAHIRTTIQRDTCIVYMYTKTHTTHPGENSYSYVNDDVVGLTVVDRFTYFLLHALEQLKPTSNVTLAQLFAWLR